jgi:integrase
LDIGHLANGFVANCYTIVLHAGMDDMTKRPPGFVRRPNGYWYYRARVPKDLHRFCKERDKWISLGTKDEGEAKVFFHLVAAEKLREYAAIREKHAAFLGQKSINPPSETIFVVDRQEAVLLAKAYLAERLSTGESLKTARDYDDQVRVDDYRDELRTNIGELCNPDSVDIGHDTVVNTARNLLREGGHELPPRQRLDAEFLGIVRRMLVALNRIELDRLDGDFRDDPRDMIMADFAKSRHAIQSARLHSMTVQKAIEKFGAEEISVEPKAAKTLVRYKAAFGLLARFLGEQTLMRDVIKDQLIAYRDTLIRMPSNYSKRFSASETFENMTAETQRLGLPVLSFKTREIYISLLKRLFRWAAANDFIRKDISQGIKIGGEKTAGRKKRRSFTVAELNKIFSAPVFTGCKDDERGYATPGSKIIKRSRYWLPLIALFTGMRMGEILQLRASHVRRSPKGNHFFYLTDLGEEEDGEEVIGMELKTFNSRREVPIHSVLINSGFLNFVVEKGERGDCELFPDVLPAVSDGKKSSTFSKRFSRFLGKVGVKPQGNGNCFHMFRHTMRDAIRNCLIPEEIADAVQGWARDQDVGRNYGSGFEVDAIAEVWERLAYPGFEYGHLLTEKAS